MDEALEGGRRGDDAAHSNGAPARGLLPLAVREYFRYYGLTARRMRSAKPDAIIMHPGPINRGVEIASEVADGPYSVILGQVASGVAIRMAVLYLVIGGRDQPLRDPEG